MSDENEIVKSIVEGAVKGLADNAPPIYNDLIKPGAQQLGQGIANVLKIAFSPVSVTVWGFEQIADWLTLEMTKRLKNVPVENIIRPKISVVGPAIENIKFLNDEPQLRDMFAELIACSLNKETADQVHPGFVETLKNLSGNDARFLRFMRYNNGLLHANVIFSTPDEDTMFGFVSEVNPDNSLTDIMLLSLSNLDRLGLILPYESFYGDDMGYFLNINRKQLELIPKEAEVISRYHHSQLSEYGKLFCKICLG